MRAAAAASGAAGELLQNIGLVASEAITNVVRHAYDDPGGEIHVAVCVGSQQLTLVVADDGTGLAVGASVPGLGLGLVLMERFSDRLTVTSPADGGFEVRMIFDAPPGEVWVRPPRQTA